MASNHDMPGQQYVYDDGNESSGGDDELIALPNGSCLLPPLDEIREIDPEFAVPMYQIKERIGLRVPVFVFALIAIYISLMLIVDARKETRRSRRKSYAAHLKIGRLVAACITAVILTYNSLSLWMEISGNVNCNWFWKSENALYWLGISAVYTVLWLRQRVLYNEPNLRRVVSRMTSFFSYATVVMVFALPVINSLTFSSIFKLCYADYQKICIFLDEDEYGTLYKFLNVVEFIVPVVLPLTLLFLFAWPLIQHHRSSNKNAKGQRSLISVLRRILILTIICLITDMAAMACNVVCDLRWMLTLHQFSSFSNLVCLQLSFADWRDIFLPKTHKESTVVSENSSSAVTISLREIHSTS